MLLVYQGADDRGISAFCRAQCIHGWSLQDAQGRGVSTRAGVPVGCASPLAVAVGVSLGAGVLVEGIAGVGVCMPSG
jgi:hypothetical protein